MAGAISGSGIVARGGLDVKASGISTSLVWVLARGEGVGRAGYMLLALSSFGGQRPAEADGELTTRSKLVANGLRIGVDG